MLGLDSVRLIDCCEELYYALARLNQHWWTLAVQGFSPAIALAATHDALALGHGEDPGYLAWIDELALLLERLPTQPRFAPAMRVSRESIFDAQRDALRLANETARVAEWFNVREIDPPLLPLVYDFAPVGETSAELEISFGRVLDCAVALRLQFRTAATTRALGRWAHELSACSIAALVLWQRGARGNGTCFTDRQLADGISSVSLDTHNRVYKLRGIAALSPLSADDVVSSALDATHELSMSQLEARIAQLHACFVDRATDFANLLAWSLDHAATLFAYEHRYWNGSPSPGWERFLGARRCFAPMNTVLPALDPDVEQGTKDRFVEFLCANGWRRHGRSRLLQCPFGTRDVAVDDASTVLRGVALERTSKRLQAFSSDISKLLAQWGVKEWTEAWLRECSLVFAFAHAHLWSASQIRWWLSTCALFPGPPAAIGVGS